MFGISSQYLNTVPAMNFKVWKFTLVGLVWHLTNLNILKVPGYFIFTLTDLSVEPFFTGSLFQHRPAGLSKSAVLIEKWDLIWKKCVWTFECTLILYFNIKEPFYRALTNALYSFLWLLLEDPPRPSLASLDIFYELKESKRSLKIY